jgi:hypothetical protein
MNDTCPKYRKPLKFAVTEQHPSHRNLAVHKFVCATWGAVKTTILLRKQSKSRRLNWEPKIDLPERMAACSGCSGGLSQCKSTAVFQMAASCKAGNSTTLAHNAPQTLGFKYASDRSSENAGHHL